MLPVWSPMRFYSEIRRVTKSYGVLWLLGKIRSSMLKKFRAARFPSPKQIIQEWPPLLTPLVSVIIPVGPHPTKRLLASIRQQQLPEWLELVAVGSETSLAGWKTWISALGPAAKVRTISLDIPGPSRKRNHGAKSTTSPFLLFVDEDDEIDLKRLSQALARAVNTEGAPWTVHQFPYEISREETISRAATPGVFLHHSSTLIPRALFEAAGGYQEVEAEDAILLAQLSRFPHKFHPRSKPFFRWIDNQSADRRRKGNRSELDLFRNLLAADSRIEENQPQQKKSLALHRFAIISARPSMPTQGVWEIIGELLRSDVPVPDPVSIKELKATQSRSLERERAVSGFRKEREMLLSFLLDSLRFPELYGCWPNPQTAVREWNLVAAVKKFGIITKRPSPQPVIELTVTDKNDQTDSVTDYYLEAATHYSSFRIHRAEESAKDKPSRARRIMLSARHVLFTSQVLRLGQDSRSHERKIAGYVAASRLREIFADPDHSLFRLYGTGPSATNISGLAPEVGGHGVACNSWVKQPKLLKKLGVRVIVAGDPVFHAGPSDYAKKFREDLTHWLRLDNNHAFVTVTRDAHIYAHYLPTDVHDQVLTLDMRVSMISSAEVKLHSIHQGGVPPYSNVLPLLLLPVAIIGRAKHIHLSGFDGDGSENRNSFWDHSATVQYSDLKGSVKDLHPEFFNRGYQEYRDNVSRQIGDVANLARAFARLISSEVPSSHPGIRQAASVRRLHASSGK